jgi:hypothetical protein
MNEERDKNQKESVGFVEGINDKDNLRTKTACKEFR